MTDTGWAWIERLEEGDVPDADAQDVSWAFPFPLSMEKVRRSRALFSFPRGLDPGAVMLFDMFDGASPRTQ
jgi:hypothetical protein